MRIAVAQTSPVFGDIVGNTARALELLENQQADLYILPELFSTGYAFSDSSEALRLAEESDGPTVKAVCRFSQKTGSFVAFGFAERQGSSCHNSAALVGPAGVLGIYRKVHLFDREKEIFRQGRDGFPVFRLPFGIVGLMICFDWLFPESARTLAVKGAQLILHPSNLVLPYCPEAMITRCIENQIFAATSDRVGTEDRGGAHLRFIGSSQVVSPRGEVLCRLDGTSEGMGIADVDLSDAEQKQITNRNHVLADRRTDQYEL